MYLEEGERRKEEGERRKEEGGSVGRQQKARKKEFWGSSYGMCRV